MPAFDVQDYTKSLQWGMWNRLMPVMRPYRRDVAGMFAFNLIMAPIDGFASAMGVALFVLILGGFLGVVMKTGALNAGITAVAKS